MRIKITKESPKSLVQQATLPPVDTTRITRRIAQTWETRPLPPDMQAATAAIRAAAPDFEYVLLDNIERRAFIAVHFTESVTAAYDALIPGAYRADLWRYCYLYVHGGVYVDIKYVPQPDFRFEVLLSKEHFMLDLPTPVSDRSIQNSVLCVKPRSPYMLSAITTIVANVMNRLYGKSCQCITGPLMLASIIPPSATSAELQFSLDETGKQQITWCSTPALKEFANYRAQMSGPTYTDQWIAHAIYRNAPI
jgi:mannosyltransferase OCH1-like enzyme